MSELGSARRRLSKAANLSAASDADVDSTNPHNPAAGMPFN
jgi:hypothetical protein